MKELTIDEIRKTPMSVHGKVLTVLNEWEGWADKADNLPCVKK
jgi:hypothetical protein